MDIPNAAGLNLTKYKGEKDQKKKESKQIENGRQFYHHPGSKRTGGLQCSFSDGAGGGGGPKGFTDSQPFRPERTTRRSSQILILPGISGGFEKIPEDEKLLAAVNRSLKKEYRGLFYNMTVEKYFKNPQKIRSHIELRAKTSGVLSPYDDLVKTYAAQYGFDWRLIVALMFKESRFDPEARSFAGARGLMQMLPKTAHALGFVELTDPETSIHAGIKYLDRLRKYFEPELPVHERMNFILAAYNAGQGHVRDARILARQLGLNPDRWFDHVEKAMELLSKREYARHARFGYVRGHETVKYLREIRKLYRGYTAVADGV